MNLLVLAPLLTFALTSVMSIAGVGAAFILVPIFYWLGMPVPEAGALGLLLVMFNTGAAALNFHRGGNIKYRTAVALIVTVILFSPLGSYASVAVDKNIVLAVFAVFLVVAGSMMLFYHPPKPPEDGQPRHRLWGELSVGGGVGFLSGLLGVGGGGFIGPFLIWMGLDAKDVAGTTAFIVFFSGIVGFLGHLQFYHGRIDYALFALTAVAAVCGGILGSNLSRFKLSSKQIKQIIGVVEYIMAAKIFFDLSKIFLSHVK